MGIRLLDSSEFEGNVIAQLGDDNSTLFLTKLISGKKVAIKRVPRLTEAGVQELAIQRLTWIFSLSETLPLMVEVLRLQNGDLILVEEYIEGPSLKTLVEERGCLTELQTKYVLRIVLEALSELHSRGLVHGALDPAHLIAQAKFIDVSGDDKSGSGTRHGKLPAVVPVEWSQSSIQNENGEYLPVFGVQQSSPYGPPEQLLSKVYSGSDVYTLGLSALYLATGRNPWEIRHPRKNFLREAGISFAFIEVLEAMLEPNAFVRPSVQELLLALNALPGAEFGLFEEDTSNNNESLSFECVGEFKLSRDSVFVATRLVGDLQLAIASDIVRVVQLSKTTWFSSLWGRLCGKESYKWALTPVLEYSGGEGGHKLVACHFEEQYAVSSGESGLVCIWDSTTGAPLRNFTPQVEKTLALLFHPNGKFLLLVGRSGYRYFFEVWDIRLCAIKATVELPSYFRAASFSASGNFLTFVLSDLIIVYSTVESDCSSWSIVANHKSLKFDHRVSIAWHHRREFFAVPDERGIIHLYSAAQEESSLVLYGNGRSVNGLCFIPESDFLLTSNNPGELLLWNFVTGKLLECVAGKICDDGFLIPIPEHSLVVAIKRLWETVTLWHYTPITKGPITKGSSVK